MELFAKYNSGVRVVDTNKLNEEVPLPRPPTYAPPVLVVGGDTDCIVDIPAVEETAEHYGVEAIILPNTAHDIMLVHTPALPVCTAACYAFSDWSIGVWDACHAFNASIGQHEGLTLEFLFYLQGYTLGGCSRIDKHVAAEASWSTRVMRGGHVSKTQ